MKINVAIGSVLRQTRESKSLALRTVAHQGCVSVGHLSDIERGNKQASTEVLEPVLKVLQLTPSDFYSLVSEELLVDEWVTQWANTSNTLSSLS